MKKIIYLFNFVFISTSVFGSVHLTDTVKVKTKKNQIVIFSDSICIGDSSSCENSKFSTDANFRIGVNGYLLNDQIGLPKPLAMMELDYAKSRSAEVNAFIKPLEFLNGHAFFSPGIGLAWNNYRFKNNIQLSTGNDTLVAVFDSVTNFSKYKLRATYIQVPVVLGFLIHKQNPVQINVGIIAGYNLNSVVKSMYNVKETEYETTITDNFNLSPFRLDLTAGIGFNEINLFARYGLTSLFQKNKTENLVPFTVGVSLGLY